MHEDIKEKAHFIEGESIPNTDLILKDLASKDIFSAKLKDSLLLDNWENHSSEVIDQLKSYIDEKRTSTSNEKITLRIYVDSKIKSNLSASRFSALMIKPLSNIIERNFNANEIPDLKSKTETLRNILLIAFSINFLSEKILKKSLNKDTLTLGEFPLPQTESHEIKEILDHLQAIGDTEHSVEGMVDSKILRDIDFLQFRSKKDQLYSKTNNKYNPKTELINLLNGSRLNEIYKILTAKINEIEKNKLLTVEVKLAPFVKILYDRINIVNSVRQKEESKKETKEFTKIFEKQNESVRGTSKTFLVISLSIFVSIATINGFLFYNNYNSLLSTNQFIQNFLGHNIYLFTIEIILLFLAFYCLSLYKSYLKLEELYNSYILLIKSDSFYKFDEQFIGDENKKELFQMRKENTQKIHMLPFNTFNLLNGKETLSDNPSSLNILLEKILKRL